MQKFMLGFVAVSTLGMLASISFPFLLDYVLGGFVGIMAILLTIVPIYQALKLGGWGV